MDDTPVQLVNLTLMQVDPNLLLTFTNNQVSEQE